MNKCWAEYLLWAVVAVLGVLAIMAQVGCGQKGPLYLPDSRPPAEQATER